MPETSKFQPESKFTLPPIDAKLEAVSPERLEELKDIFKHHQELVGSVITDRGMAELYEDLLHIDRFDPLVLNDFFVDGLGDQVARLGKEMHEHYPTNDVYDVGIEDVLLLPHSKAASSQLLDFLVFMEDLVDFIEGIQLDNEVKIQIQQVHEDLSTTKYVHEDYELGIIANFDVSGPTTHYVFMPFTEPEYGGELTTNVNRQYTEQVPIQSNQLIILATRMRAQVTTAEGASLTLPSSTPHGVYREVADHDAHSTSSRIRLMVYQRETQESA